MVQSMSGNPVCRLLGILVCHRRRLVGTEETDLVGVMGEHYVRAVPT